MHTDAEHEVVERLVVDVHERHLHGQSEVGQVSQVLPAFSFRLLFFLTNTNQPAGKGTELSELSELWPADGPTDLHAGEVVADIWGDAGRCHVGAANGLDFCDAAELGFIQQLKQTNENPRVTLLISERRLSPTYAVKV